MNDTQKTIDELKSELHDLKTAIEKLNNGNKKPWFTRFKIWLRQTDPEGLSNYDGVVAAGLIAVALCAFTVLSVYIGTLPKRKTLNDEPITIQAKVDIQDAGAK